MCGIAGIVNIFDEHPIERRSLEKMIAMLHHRGPDGMGIYLKPDIGLAHTRLSIIDIGGGAQPISNEDRTLWVVFNGEIFNYLELRRDLEKRGHRFSTHSDTEVIIHLFEEKGEKCLYDLNGQFAMALWDEKKRRLFLARDRMGIRPLYFLIHAGRCYFGSEIKAIFAADSSILREIEPDVLGENFTFWMPAGKRTIFKNIRQLLPGHFAWVDRNGIRENEYWDIPLAPCERRNVRSEPEYIEEMRELLIDSIRLQLRADVPVGAYLSGGLDSSSITALVRGHAANRLKTFSVTFSDATYDESLQQEEVVSFLNTDHAAVRCESDTIASVFPEVIWHAETAILRTAPAPLFLLSRLVRDSGFKVVLTGEGADEILGGYDIFKEAKIRAFIHRDLASVSRPQLLKRLYPYLAFSPTESASYAVRFFDVGASPADPFYAHRPRWKTTSWTHNFFRKEFANFNLVNPVDSMASVYADKLAGLDFFSAAQYLEAKTLLANYLLSSQGDRMAMAHSVEGRFPFLDHRLVEFAGKIPPVLRMKGLCEKYILKKAMAGLLPPAIIRRKKQPYMAPDITSFSGKAGKECIDRYLSDGAIAAAGIFRPQAVQQLLQKCIRSQRQGFRENMAFVGILSTQILFEKFIVGFSTR
ncbi:MAG: asparagine synthase (glutamine-hydrolyzing) [Geobacter sp.]|nr:asparagine synthase (glutamine-hydrolyzing) [Geobacter sp.]